MLPLFFLMLGTLTPGPRFPPEFPAAQWCLRSSSHSLSSRSPSCAAFRTPFPEPSGVRLGVLACDPQGIEGDSFLARKDDTLRAHGTYSFFSTSQHQFGRRAEVVHVVGIFPDGNQWR